MQHYIYAHHVEREYDLNCCDDVSEMIYDYIKWWVFDLIVDGDVNQAKLVLNSGFIVIFLLNDYLELTFDGLYATMQLRQKGFK